MKQSKKIQSINIKTPCRKEAWNEMSIAGKDRLCGSCNTIVVDFTNFSDKEIIEYFEKRKFQKTCGRFSKTQLDHLNLSISKPSTSSPINWMKAALLVSTISLVSCNTSKLFNRSKSIYELNEQEPKPEIKIVNENIMSAKPNTTIFKGRILIDNKAHFAANVIYGETELATITDMNGYFELEIPNSKITGSDLLVTHTGTKDFKLKSEEIKNKEIEVILDSEDIYYILGEVQYQ